MITELFQKTADFLNSCELLRLLWGKKEKKEKIKCGGENGRRKRKKEDKKITFF